MYGRHIKHHLVQCVGSIGEQLLLNVFVVEVGEFFLEITVFQGNTRALLQVVIIAQVIFLQYFIDHFTALAAKGLVVVLNKLFFARLTAMVTGGNIFVG